MSERGLLEDLADGKRSPYAQYCEMFVGRSGLWALARYELVTGVLGAMPGALGYLLRSRLYPRLMRRCGRKCRFGRGMSLRAPGRIELGDCVLVDDFSVLDAKGERSRLVLGGHVLLSRGCILSCNNALIRFGDHVSVGPYCNFGSRSRLEIGSNVSIGPGSQVLAGGHAIDDPEVPALRQSRLSQGIRIEDGVWLGASTTVLDGAVIGSNSVIGAGAVVRGQIPPNSVAAGVPARVLYDRHERGRRRAGMPGADGTP